MKKTEEEEGITIAFLLINDFSMMCFSSFIEPLRSLNRHIGQDYYSWIFVSEDGKPVQASNGAYIMADRSIDQLNHCDAICVCAGLDVTDYAGETTLAWLRRESRKGRMIGALSTGTYILAKAGLLKNHRCTTHWEYLDGLPEMFPELNVTGRLYEVDGNHFSCAGGTAASDLVLHWIDERYGPIVKTAVADQFLLGTGRSPDGPQKSDQIERYRIYNPNLNDVIRLMEGNIEEPLSRHELAAAAKVTTRQLERLFSKHLQCSPSLFYLRLRLERASYFLRQTTMAVSEVSVACGFVSFSHFSVSYRKHFGHSPTKERIPEKGRAGINPRPANQSQTT